MLRCKHQVIRIALIISFLCAYKDINAQMINFYGGVGYASYNHAELKSYQVFLIKASGLDAIVIDEFPAFYTYNLGFTIHFSKWILGIDAGHGSTAGRVYYEDYSGRLILDQLIAYNYLGVTPSISLKQSSKFYLMGGIKLSIVSHTLSVRNILTLGTQSVYEEEDFQGFNLAIQPNLVLRKYFGKAFLQVSIGYELQNRSYPESDTGFFLDNGSGNPVHLQGDGFRINLGAGFLFGSKK